MRLVRAGILCVSLSQKQRPSVTSPNPPVPLNAGLIGKLPTGRQSPQKARLIKHATSPLMSEHQYQVLQPVIVTPSSLKTYTGDIFLNDCFKVASVTEKDSDGVVLGLKSDEGPVSMKDFTLGQVTNVCTITPLAFIGRFTKLCSLARSCVAAAL